MLLCAQLGGLVVVWMEIFVEWIVFDLCSYEGYEWFYVLLGWIWFVFGDDELVFELGEVVEFLIWMLYWIGVIDGFA